MMADAFELAVDYCYDLGFSEDEIDEVIDQAEICCNQDICMENTFAIILGESIKKEGKLAASESTPPAECPYYGDEDWKLKNWFEGYIGKPWEAILTDEFAGEYALSKEQMCDELPDKFFDLMSCKHEC